MSSRTESCLVLHPSSTKLVQVSSGMNRSTSDCDRTSTEPRRQTFTENDCGQQQQRQQQGQNLPKTKSKEAEPNVDVPLRITDGTDSSCAHSSMSSTECSSNVGLTISAIEKTTRRIRSSQHFPLAEVSVPSSIASPTSDASVPNTCTVTEVSEPGKALKRASVFSEESYLAQPLTMAYSTPSKPQHEKNAEAEIDDEFQSALLSQRKSRVLLSRLREAIPQGRLSIIDLSRRGLDVSHAFLLKEAITHSPQLSVLKLAYNEFCDEGTTILAMAFCQNGVHHKHLSVVDLAFNEIGDMGCEALAVHAMAGNYVLRAIDLSGNQVGERGALSIAGAILHGTGLSRLHMSANRIGSMGVQAIAGAIANRDSRIAETEAALTGSTEIHSIVDLQLGTVLIASGGFAAIPGMLVTNTTLRSLCVSNNNLDDQDILLMSQALTQNKRLPLEELVLSFNQITCQGVETLMNSIWGSTTLKEIKLDNNRLRDRGAQLCAVVLTSIPLQSLDIGCNAVTSAGIKALMKNVSENSSLISLGLAGIHIDQNSSKAVSYALAYNTSLQAVYFDNSHAGYSAQRHIVAGIISNQSAPLRLLTGFPLAPIAVTLGVPRLPEVWSNDQVLGFFRLMWRQWAIKAGRGNVGKGDIPRGPAPPAAVAAAAKVAFASLGTALQTLFQTEMYEKPISERPSVDPSDTALLERSLSGTLEIPKCSFVNEDELSEWEGGKSKMDGTDTLPSSAHTLSVQETYENSERRSRNLRWLRLHFRSLSEVGRIPFNNAELWHLHQYYFSPPNVVLHDCDGLHHEVTSTPARGMAAPSTPNQQPSAPGMGRAISFQSLGNAFSVSRSLSHAGGHKRRSEKQCQSEEQPALKRPKNSKPRIAYYPRIMTKLQALGSSQADQILALLRQLKFAESLLFAGKSLYCDEPSIADNEAHYSDVEMILLDLL